MAATTTYELSDDAATVLREYAGKLAGKTSASYRVPMSVEGLTVVTTLTVVATPEGLRVEIQNTEFGDTSWVQSRPRDQVKRDVAALKPIAKAWEAAMDDVDADRSIATTKAILAACEAAVQ